MEGHGESEVVLTHSAYCARDVAEPSTLSLVLQHTGEAPYTHIEVCAYVMELRLVPFRLKAAEEHNLYRETFILDEAWHELKEQQQVLALYLGSSKEEAK